MHSVEGGEKVCDNKSLIIVSFFICCYVFCGENGVRKESLLFHLFMICSVERIECVSNLCFFIFSLLIL